MTPSTPYIQTPELDALLRLGVRETLATTDFPTALAAFLAALPETAPDLVAEISPGAERAFGFALLREIWNRTPRPDRGWKRLPLAKPERNAPCPCGSGRKYKQCCAKLEGLGPPLPDRFTLLGYVLETIPVARYRTLPYKQLDPEEVAHVASEWGKEGRIEPAILLLEALLSPDGKLDARHEFAFDELCNLYLDAGRPAERLALVERFQQATDKSLRVAAWQRRATIHADAGELDDAWRAFKEAQRLDPDNPALSHLELTLLANEGRFDEAQTRAAFWARRLTKLGYGNTEIVAFLEAVAEDPAELAEMFDNLDAWEIEDVSKASEEQAEAFIRLIENLPVPACHYRLSCHEDSAGPLVPTAELAAIEAEWERIYWGDEEDRDAWEDSKWIDWLAHTPLAWQSFAVIEDVVDIFEYELFPAAYEERLNAAEARLIDHAVALLRRVIAENDAEGKKLEWSCLENRSALRLLMHAAEFARETDTELPLLEWLLALNPDDNGGQRQRLVHLYCELGRPADALAVCERYPDDDLPGTLYGRVLALYLLGRRGEAVAALAHARERLPKVLDMLIAQQIEPPAMTPGIIKHGSDDEAWQYRLECRGSWEKCNALGWLKEVAGYKA